jgi:hypothetical protein
MRMDAEETLAESNENGNVENRIWGQLVQLNPVDEKVTTEKFVDRGGEAANEKVNECYLESDRRMREAFIARELQGLLLLQQAKFLQHLLVLGGDLGPLPARDLGLLHRGVSARSLVLQQLRARSHGGVLWWKNGLKGSKSVRSSEMAMAERERESRCAAWQRG